MLPPKYKGQVSIGGRRHSAGTASIILPAGEDRAQYVAQCKRTGSVSILTDNGEYIHRVRIGKLALNLIDFPSKVGELGSGVIWVNVPKHNHPMIVDVFAKGDEMEDDDEQQFAFRESSDIASVAIIGKGASGELFINVESDTAAGGRLVINLTNASKKAELVLHIQGDATCVVEGSVNVSATEKIHSVIIDDNGQALTHYTLTPDSFTVDAQKITHGKGSSSMLLGEKTRDVIKAFIEEVAKSTVATALGTMPLLNAVQILALERKLLDILSTQSKLE